VNFQVVLGKDFLANFHEILDFALLNLILNITDSRLLLLLKKLKFGGP
jgi:hypothetical protein